MLYLRAKDHNLNKTSTQKVNLRSETFSGTNTVSRQFPLENRALNLWKIEEKVFSSFPQMVP